MQQQLERNVKLFGVLKIFTKRVFLPLTTVYLVIVGGLNVKQIGLLATISAIASLASEIPTGYFADRLTRRASLMLAGLFAAVATLFYAFTPFFIGAIVAVTFESIGYAFLNGPGEALLHDTLLVLKREDDYPKIVGRAQSLGLVGNTVLVALVPLTYAISPRLPFLCGTLTYFALIITVKHFYEPPRSEIVKRELSMGHDLMINLRKFVTRRSLLIFISIGALGALYTSSSDFTNLIFKDLGLQPRWFGLVYAGASVVGILGGYFIHYLRNLSLKNYAILDTVVFSATFLVIGIGHSLPMAIFGFALSMGWWRLRAILYQHHLLKLFKHSAYKSTLISVYGFFIRGNEAWLPFMFVLGTAKLGFYNAFIVIGIVALAALVPLFFVAIKLMQTGPQHTA